MKTNVIASLKKFKTLATVIALNLIVSSGAFAAVTTLTFDNLAAGSLVSNQYAGVTFASPIVIQSSPAFPAQSGTQLAFAEEGLIDITLSSSLGPVQKISGYVSGTMGATVSAYSSSNVLLGQQMLLSGNNVQFAITSSTSPIARVIIDGQGDIVALDTFTYETAETVPVCEAINQNLYNSINAVALSQYKVAKTAPIVKAALLLQVAVFQKALQKDVTSKDLLKLLTVLKASVDCGLKPSAQKTAIMQMIEDLIAKTKANIC